MIKPEYDDDELVLLADEPVTEQQDPPKNLPPEPGTDGDHNGDCLGVGGAAEVMRDWDREDDTGEDLL